MSSPLSFDSTENFRRKLLIRNLPPYKEGYKGDDFPGDTEFSINDVGVMDPGSVEVIGDNQERLLYVKNKYGPENSSDYGDTVNVNINKQTETNQGEYDYYSSPPSLTEEQSITLSYLQNYYAPDDGYSEKKIEDVIRLIEERSTYYKFISSTYGLYNLITKIDPPGSEGMLSEDSDLAKIASTQLKQEFVNRISQETYQQTLGRINLIDASRDPFDALGIITGNKGVIEKDWKISVPDGVIGKGLDFISRITGVYSPYSWIPGDYFSSEEKKSYLNQAVNAVGNLFGNRGTPLLPQNKKASDIFLANTGRGQTSRLFANIEKSKFRPDYKLNFANDPNITAPNGEYYIGNRNREIGNILFPSDQLPYDEYGNKSQSPIRGYSDLADEYENTNNNFEFGLNGYSYYNKSNSLLGGFTWVSLKNQDSAGEYVGRHNSRIGASDSISFKPWEYEKSRSTEKEFTKGSILDDTQKLIDSAFDLPGDKQLRHVGNAISQISKVFHDGTREITKGAKVFNYVDENNQIVGKEYCRLFTKDMPYANNSDLQKSKGMVNDGRKFEYSVLDNTYNLNIAPWKSDGVTKVSNINKENAKKYMFSLENLAWRTSNKKGFTYQDLPLCERGPNGGRIMWFPPYDMKVSEQNSTNWTANEFLGRPEPIYTYNNTTRQGTLSWKIIVDHPSVMNAIIDKELKNDDNERVNEIVESFLYGCRNYDIYELATRFPRFTYSDIYEIIENTTNIESFSSATKEIPRYKLVPQDPIIETYEKQIEREDYNFSFYFDDNIPGPSTGVTTEEDYLTTLNNYRSESVYNDYVNYCPHAEKEGAKTFFNDVLPNIEKNAAELAVKIGKAVKEGASIEMRFTGGASAPNTEDYNEKIAKRRVDTVQRYILSQKDEDGNELEKHKDKIKFGFEFKGEGLEASSGTGERISCTEELTGLAKKYSLNAMWCRGVIIDVIKEIQPPPEEREIPQDPIRELDGYDTVTVTGTTVTPVKTKDLKRKKNAAKIIVKKLLTECDYFYQMDQYSPMVFNGIKEKFKYFHPAFHSMTPEGLNSRLTFLQQCMRPGDTIPTIGDDGKPREDDAKNTSFGAPPICVLRIGDFYHSKIAINQIGINYEPLTFDLNTEGIGVQPMIADINMSFYFIGGQGLKEPVSRLQNALSFNFYANTEIYDERAEVTDVDSNNAINEDVWRRIEEETEFGLQNRNDEEDTTEGGNTIGEILETTIANETLSGKTSYKKVVNELVEKFNNYINTLNTSIEEITTKNSEIALYYFFKNRRYKYGQIFNYFDQQNAETIQILGKPTKLQEMVDNLVNMTVQDIENGTSPLIKNIDNQGFKNRDKKIYKKNVTQLVKDCRDYMINNLTQPISKIEESEIEMIKVIDKINLVASNTDGYRIKSGKNIIYEITPTTDIHETSTSFDTKDEIKDDLTVMSIDIADYNKRILNEEDSSQPSLLNSYKFNEGSFNFGFLDGDFDTEENTRLCTLLFYRLIDDDYLVTNNLIIESGFEDKPEWVSYINKIFYGTEEQTIDIGVGAEFEDGTNTTIVVSEEVSGLLDVYKKLEKQSKDNLKDFKESDEVIKFVDYEPFSKDKERVYTYVKLTNDTMDSNKNDNFNKTYSGVNGGSPSTFNLKRKLN